MLLTFIYSIIVMTIPGFLYKKEAEEKLIKVMMANVRSEIKRREGMSWKDQTVY